MAGLQYNFFPTDFYYPRPQASSDINKQQVQSISMADNTCITTSNDHNNSSDLKIVRGDVKDINKIAAKYSPILKKDWCISRLISCMILTIHIKDACRRSLSISIYSYVLTFIFEFVTCCVNLFMPVVILYKILSLLLKSRLWSYVFVYVSCVMFVYACVRDGVHPSDMDQVRLYIC